MPTFQFFNFERDKKILKRIFIGLIVIACLIIIKDEIEYRFGLGFWSEESMEEYFDDEFYDGEYAIEDCNVQGIELQGDLYTYYSSAEVITDVTVSEEIVSLIDYAEIAPEVKAIFLEVDSLGGAPVAAEEVASALKRAKKPTVALIREYGVSAAYWAACGADMIFASANSDVGSIGVTFSYLDNVEQNRKEGLAFQQLSAGKFKDAGDPNKPLTAEERALFKRDIKILHENFIKDVAENRNLEVAAVRELADGSSMLGQMALDHGLIDRIGGIYEVKEYLRVLIGEEVEVCW